MTGSAAGSAPSDLLVPAPATWRQLRPTDTPVLRNDLWDAYRSITRGAWCVSVYSDHSSMRLLATQDCVVDDFGELKALGDNALAAATAWYASTFSIDVAASDWMDQFNDPLPRATPLRVMADQARQQHQQPAADANPVQARCLPEPRACWYAASVKVDDDIDWLPGEPMVSVEIEHDEPHRLLLTGRQARALGALLVSLALTACGGGGDDPDVATPRVDCRVEVCR
jgi:hypothetical protein